MVDKPHISNRWARIFFIFLIGFLWPLAGGASSELISESDLDNSDPVKFSSRIMSVDYAKGVLVVAETEVMIVDMLIGGDQFTSQVFNPAGDAISIESLSEGYSVMVQGLKLEDGRVVAAMVQILDASGVTIEAVRPIQPVE